MKRLLHALFLSFCAACGAGLVDHSGVDLTTLTCSDPGTQNCSGVCTATDSDVNNCGHCGNSCATPTLSSSRTCSQSRCGFTCTAGFFLCASGLQCCPASAIAAGGDTSCALVDTKVRCWGANDSWQLGTDPTGAWSPKPLLVPGLPPASSVAVGGQHACAIAAGTGEVWCWGSNTSGQLGDGTTTAHGAQKVSGISGATSLALGGLHSCALTPAGLVCWGANESGQLGDGSRTDAHVPNPPVTLPAAPTSISAGLAFTCAIASTSPTSSMYCWGNNGSGQLNETADSYSTNPQLISSVSSVVSIGSGAAHACAISSGSSFWCWGADSFGQVGDGKMQARSPVSGVNGLSAPAKVTGGLAHTCAIDGNGGALFCWGSNSSGQLGTGLPNQVELKPAHALLNGVRSLALGATHSCAQTGDDVVSCWGNDSRGQVGVQATNLAVLQPTPIQQ